MFTFLTRLGRVFVGITVFVAVLGVLGIVTTTGILVSHHQAAGSQTCSISMGSVVNGQQRLLITAGGLTASTQYLEAQPGVQSVWITTSTSGSSSDQSLVYHGAGNYTVAFDYYYWSNNKLVQATATSCSASL